MEGRQCEECTENSHYPSKFVGQHQFNTKIVVFYLFFWGKSGSVTSGRRRRIAGVVSLPPVSAQLAIWVYV